MSDENADTDGMMEALKGYVGGSGVPASEAFIQARYGLQVLCDPVPPAARLASLSDSDVISEYGRLMLLIGVMSVHGDPTEEAGRQARLARVEMLKRMSDKKDSA